ncbi:MAG: peptidyl-prolyl cis-trans isomerase [Maribacter sp.]|uniref:peptidyl-prolyl cis-trans isomerase n=1 Tax=Maribacter sp. TaxID=1897614 RepID=UPI003297461C
MFLKKRKALTLGFTVTIAFLFIGSCGSFLKDADETGPIARVGESYLYKEDIASLLYDGMTKGDSATIVTNFINNWATKQLLLTKAKINLPEDKLAEFDALVADYQTDLYTRAYKDALVQQAADSMVTETQLKRFYENEKENFRLQERLVKIRFVQLPKRFLNKDEVTKRLKSFKKKDIAYLDSIGVQFKKLNFNDSLWVSASRVINEIPPLTLENQDKYLKKSQFFELEDALGVYLAMVTGVLQVNDVAPLSFIEPTIKQVLINRRKLNYIRQLETEVIDEAIKEKEFEVYAHED